MIKKVIRQKTDKILKNPKKVKMGKKSRASGADFERRTRKDLERKGWIVDKFSNNVEIIKSPNEKGEQLIVPEECKLVPAKAKWRGRGIPMMMSSGFPDFLAFKTINEKLILCKECKCPIDGDCWCHECEKTQYNIISILPYEVIGVESKTDGRLDKIEKAKCKWLLDNKIFSKILIAFKEKEGRRIVVKYKEFQK